MANKDAKNPLLMAKMEQVLGTQDLAEDAPFADDSVRKGFPGLFFLRKDTGFFVQQDWEVLEYVTSCWEAQNRYRIFDTQGNYRLFIANEKTNVWWRYCCLEYRPFRFHFQDMAGAGLDSKGINREGKKALVMTRNYRCCGWALFPCCAHEVDMHYMSNNKDSKPIGSISQYTRVARVRVPWLGGCCWPTYYLEDYAGKLLAYVRGPFCFVCDCCGADFEIKDTKGSNIGHIKKLRPYTMKELAYELETEADNYHVNFDHDVPFNLKLAALAATFLIDFNFFEDRRGVNQCRFCDIYCCGWGLSCIPACCLPFCCPCCRRRKKKGLNKSIQ